MVSEFPWHSISFKLSQGIPLSGSSLHLLSRCLGSSCCLSEEQATPLVPFSPPASFYCPFYAPNCAHTGQWVLFSCKWISQSEPSCHTCVCWWWRLIHLTWRKKAWDFPGGPVVKNLPGNVGDMGSIPGPGRFTCCWTTKPLCHNYWACALEPMSLNYWSLHTFEPMLHNKRSHCDEKPEFYNWIIAPVHHN